MNGDKPKVHAVRARVARHATVERDQTDSEGRGDGELLIAPSPVGFGAAERPGGKRKAGDADSNCDGEKRVPPADSSAYALLALMQSVQQAAEASAEERGRTSESYKAWKAKAQAKDDAPLAAKKRKPTHTIRKEEISVLNDEVAQLEKRLAFLRGQSVVVAPPASSSADRRTAGQLHAAEAGDPEHPQIPNGLLRDAIHEQQLSLACARSMVSQFFASDFAMPAHCYVHLTTSLVDRRRTLQAVKPQQLRVARRYVLERSRHINLTKPHAASEQFITESGDACNIRFCLTQFPSSLTVREVFEAATFFTYNLEISFTDGAGRVTIREDDDDMSDPTVVQHRFVTNVNDSAVIEGNVAMFTHYDEEEEYGLVTTTFVDRDDLYPYRSRERLRQDVTAVLLISREKDCIVMRRLGHVRIHHNEHLPISDETSQALSESVSHWGDALVRHAKQRFGMTAS